MSESRLSRYVPAAAIAIVAGVAGWVATRSLQQDFAAYWIAGAARRAGLDPYVNHVGGAAAPELWDGVAVFAHSRFLYPPIVAELFRPFATLPYAVAKAVFTALMVAAWIAASVTTARAAGGRRAVDVALGAGALFYPLHLALERGQVELLVLLLLAVAFAARVRALPAGAALAGAVALKPGLAILIAVAAALGRWRVAAAALAGVAVVALASVVVSGPALAREYATRVLPRASLYGEGGDESMLLPAERLAARADELAAGVARVGGREYPVAAWEGLASASVPRLLAPERPTRAATRAPALVVLALLVLVAAGIWRRGPSPAAEAIVLWAAAVAGVVTSPAGWVMGLVVALPLVSWLARLRKAGAPRTWGWGLVLAAGLVACAVPPPLSGWAALAGAGVAAAAAGLARTLPREAA
jgi:hypothetical protein